MPSLLARLEQPLMNIAGKLGRQPHLNAIRDGVVGALPLVLIGSLFMLILQPPLGSQSAMDWWMAHQWVMQLLVGVQILIKCVALYVAFGVAYSLAKRHDLDPLSAGLLAAAALLFMNGVRMGVLATAGGDVKGAFLPLETMPGKVNNLGSGGLFVAILLGLLVPEIQRLARKYKLEIRMPAGVPPAVGRSFSALIPGIIVLGGVWAITQLGQINVFALMNTYLAGPIANMSRVDHSVASAVIVFSIMLAVILLDSILWLFGVHAVAILAPMQAVWLAAITANAGAAHPFMLHSRETLQFFIWTGGSGATLVLPFLLLRARAQSLRAIAKVGLVPALFNINEPLIFGVPVVLNPTLVIPFIMAPVVALATTVLTTYLGWVPMPKLVVPWTLPGPIGAFLATGGAWQAVVLSLVNIGLAALIYWPFVKMLDKRMVEAEEAKEPAQA